MSGFRIDAVFGANDGEAAAEFYRALVELCRVRGVTVCEFRSHPLPELKVIPGGKDDAA